MSSSDTDSGGYDAQSGQSGQHSHSRAHSGTRDDSSDDGFHAKRGGYDDDDDSSEGTPRPGNQAGPAEAMSSSEPNGASPGYGKHHPPSSGDDQNEVEFREVKSLSGEVEQEGNPPVMQGGPRPVPAPLMMQYPAEPSFLEKLEERWDRWAQGQWCPDWCCEGPCIVITLAGACVLGLIFMVVMLAISNVPVERYNYALKFNTLDKVDLSKTYENGLYWWGPSYDAVRFSSLWERECFRGADALEVFVSSGQTMRVTACFHYKLNKTTVPTLFQQVGNAYSDPIRVTVQSAFKNAATTIPFQDYITNRRSVADTLHRTAQDAVVAAGLPVEVPRAGMLLRSVALPSTVVQQNLDVFEHKELRLQQSYAEQAASVRLDTQLNVTATLAAASAIERKAMVEAEQQRATARNAQEAALQRAMGAALSAMAGKLNVTTAADVAELGRYNGLLDAMTEADRRFTLLVPQQSVTPFL